jgi:hypothetical protein
MAATIEAPTPRASAPSLPGSARDRRVHHSNDVTNSATTAQSPIGPSSSRAFT